MINLTNILVFATIIIILYFIYNKNNIVENFLFTPWNMSTRLYPSYDIRGYPYIYPWNYPYPNLPYLLWSPYFYKANGKYLYDPKYAKLLTESHAKLIKE
jgi:hypothetical protein